MTVQVEAAIIGIYTEESKSSRKKYAVAKLLEGVATNPVIKKSVKFYLNKKVWKSGIPACEGMVVILEGLYETVSGDWIASKACPKQLQSVS